MVAYLLQSLPGIFSGSFFGGLFCFALGCIFTTVATFLGIVSLLCGSQITGIGLLPARLMGPLSSHICPMQSASGCDRDAGKLKTYWVHTGNSRRLSFFTASPSRIRTHTSRTIPSRPRRAGARLHGWRR